MGVKPSYEELEQRVKELEEKGIEHKKMEETLQKVRQKLGKRVQELNCFYGIAEIVEKRGVSLEEIFQGTVDLIPLAWQYPEITCARAFLDGREFRTSAFEETIWKQASDIVVDGKRRGALEVYYLERRPESDEGPFLKEERRLLDAIAQRLGRITDRREAREELRVSGKTFRDLVENSVTGILIVQDGQIVYKNPEQQRLFGPSHHAFSPVDFENIHPNDVEKIKHGYERLVSGKVRTLDTEFRFYPPDKTRTKPDMKWAHCRAALIGYQGKKAILFNTMDITRAKELERLVRIQDKMTSLGRVAVGISHEIRNPLSGINIYLNTLEKIYDKGESVDKVRNILAQLQSASNKIDSVIRRVMDFSKPSEPKLVLTDINQLIDQAVKLTSATFQKSGIKVEKALSEALPLCQADPHLIEQVILNLITNGAEAMKGMSGIKKMGITSAVGRDHIVLKVSDSGPGVPLELRNKIFDPFFTTKNGSTGIGLSLTHRIISDHGGTVSVARSEWGGAEFRIEIPINKGTNQG